MGTPNPQATVLLYAHPHTLLPGNTILCAVDELNDLPWSSTLAGTIKQHWWNGSCLLDVPIVGAEGNHCKCTQIVCFTALQHWFRI